MINYLYYILHLGRLILARLILCSEAFSVVAVLFSYYEGFVQSLLRSEEFDIFFSDVYCKYFPFSNSSSIRERKTFSTIRFGSHSIRKCLIHAFKTLIVTYRMIRKTNHTILYKLSFENSRQRQGLRLYSSKRNTPYLKSSD